jgi:hypothetical protein
VLRPLRRLGWSQSFHFSALASISVSILALAAASCPVVAAVQGLGRDLPSAAANPTVHPTAKPEPVRPGAVSLGELRNNLRNGIYLFGEAAAPNQSQRSYFVFQVENQQVIGAVYTPGSSFDCFYGTQKPGNLDLRVYDSYENTYYPQAIALGDYYSLQQPGGNDLRLLQACRAAVPKPANLPQVGSVPLK